MSYFRVTSKPLLKMPTTMAMLKKTKKHSTIMVEWSQMLLEINGMNKPFANAGKLASLALNRKLQSSNKVNTYRK